MKLDTKVRRLGPVDYGPLKAAVTAIHPEAWLEDKLRQDVFADVHYQTQSIILLFCDGWPTIKVTPRKGWDYFSEQAGPIIETIVETYYPPGGFVLRAMVAKLVAGGVIAPHKDIHASFAVAHRIHVPLVTNDLVDFTIDDEAFHLQEGIAYEISNLDTHGVANRSAEDRVHFIFDYAVK
jgi:hypothetical protein